MRILHLITTINRGGAENQLLTLVKQQIKDGLSVEILPLKGSLDLEKNFQSYGAHILSQITNKPWLIQILEIKKYLYKNRIDVIHAHLPRAEITAAVCAKQKKFIITRHNSEAFFPGAPQFLSSFLSRFVTSKAFKVTCISEAVKNFITEQREIVNGSEVIYYGRDKNAIQNRNSKLRNIYLSKLGIPLNSIIVTTLARLTPQKDLITLLKAFQIIATSNNETFLLIGGSGELENILKQISFDLGISSKVIWLGQVQDTSEVYNASDIFILTSKYEGFGLVLLEAMEHEIPIIASNNTSIPEVIGFHHEGLTKTGDYVQFARKIEIFLKPVKRRKILDFQKKQLLKFDIENAAKAFYNIYLSI